MPVHCSFCAKGQHEVEALIAGPMAWICNDCIDLCACISAERRGHKLRAKLAERELDEIRRLGT